MKALNFKYIIVEKLEEKKGEGVQMVEVQDCFTYKGRVKQVPEIPVCVSNHQVTPGDIVIFAKYSPDTHEIEKDKFVKVEDILAVI